MSSKYNYSNGSSHCLLGFVFDQQLKKEREAPPLPQLVLPFNPPVDMPVTGSFDDLDWDEE